jgi:hypothetical protein
MLTMEANDLQTKQKDKTMRVQTVAMPVQTVLLNIFTYRRNCSVVSTNSSSPQADIIYLI